MGTVVSGIIVLCMFYQGGIIEHTTQDLDKANQEINAKKTVDKK